MLKRLGLCKINTFPQIPIIWDIFRFNFVIFFYTINILTNGVSKRPSVEAFFATHAGYLNHDAVVHWHMNASPVPCVLILCRVCTFSGREFHIIETQIIFYDIHAKVLHGFVSFFSVYLHTFLRGSDQVHICEHGLTQLRASICNPISGFMWDPIPHPLTKPR